MKAVIYARYSSDKQTEQSIEGQIRICEQFCKNNDIDIVDYYIDRALSASKNTEKRIEFLRMIKDSEKHQWESVIVYKLDRFSRDRYDSAIYKTKLKKNGARVISATENISENPEGIILESVLEGMAEFYSKELSQKVSRGMHETALKGNSTGGIIPMGYKIENKKLVIDEAYAPVIRNAFQWYSEGITVAEICNKLNAAGYRTKKGIEFNHNSFKTIFSNKKYIGIYTYNNEVEIEDAIPAIVSKDVFDAVQNRLKKTAKAPAKYKAIEDYILSQKIFCGLCGSPIIGESGFGKYQKRYQYYTCSKRKKSHDCDKKNMKKEYVEQIVIEESLKKLTPDTINQIADIAIKSLENDKNNNLRLKAIKNELKEIESSINGLLKAFELGAASESLTKRLNELEDQKKNAEIRLIQEQKVYPTLEKEHIIFWLTSFLDNDIIDESFRRRIVDLLVNSVFVYDEPDGSYKFVVMWNLTNTPNTEIKLSDLSAYGPPYTGV